MSKVEIKEIQLLVGCTTSKEFYDKYRLAFDPGDSKTKTARMFNIWHNRDRCLRKLEAHEQCQRTIMIPAVIKHKNQSPSNGPVFADEDIGVKILNQLVYNGQVLSEMLELFKSLKKSDVPEG